MKKALITLFALNSFLAFSQKQQKFDLAQLASHNKLQLYNRHLIKAESEKYPSVKLDENASDGLAWIKGIEFSEGTIDIDLKGQDAYQKSFLGIAFHGENDSTYDAVYFRPFNFRATDSVRHIHAVQYISHPAYTWKKLRNEQNARFEKQIDPAPDPNEWFHAQIVVKGETVKVYVNGSATPSLTVEKLNHRKKGTLGLWVGDSAGGTFANLQVQGR